MKDLQKSEVVVAPILCKLECIFPPAFFDIMVHLMIHSPKEALLGGPVHYRWMYPYECYIKKLKNYVRNRARPGGSFRPFPAGRGPDASQHLPRPTHRRSASR